MTRRTGRSDPSILLCAAGGMTMRSGRYERPSIPIVSFRTAPTGLVWGRAIGAILAGGLVRLSSEGGSSEGGSIEDPG